ncbi:MAG: ATP-binding cassette domain-containing protein, partial [Acholeplasmataceae bacterium]
QYFKSGFGKNKIVVKAVDDVSFEIKKGEVFSLVGESGCGKTTTGRTIIKLYKSSGGEVYFHNTRVLSDVKAAKKRYRHSVRALKQELKLGNLTQKAYNEKLLLEKQALKKAKRDRNFENIIDESGRRAIKDIQSFQEYQDIIQKYALRLENTTASIDALNKTLASLDSKDKKQKAKLKETRNALKEAKKELALSKLRQKQDIQNLKYQLINKNKLLMRKMQMIFQDPIASLNPRMTVKEIIAEGLRINGFKNEEIIDQRVIESLETVGLVAEHASRYPHEFSGGQRQRIGIARSLVVEPSFIIADEPISALDVSIRAHIINLLNELRENKGITILFIAHDLSVVKYFSDRLAVMYFGKIVEIGDKEKIFNHPMHPYTLSLLDSIPLPDPLYEQRRQASKRYNPQAAHDYSKELPTLREIEPDHFVLCNTNEFEKYKKLL